MGGAEGVVDEDIGQLSQLLAELGVVLGLALFKAGVFEQHDLAILELVSQTVRVLACNVLRHADLDAEQLAQTVGDDLQAQLGLKLALRLAHVGAQDDAGAVLAQIIDRRQSGDDALIRGDFAFLGGNVEVAAAEHPLAADIDVFNGFLVVVHRSSSIILIWIHPPVGASVLSSRPNRADRERLAAAGPRRP